MLDCSVGNSKSQLHKAKMKMRDLLFPKRRILRRPAANRPMGISSPDDNKHDNKNSRPQLSLAYGVMVK